RYRRPSTAPRNSLTIHRIRISAFTRRRSPSLESSLYPPVKRFLEKLSLEAKARFAGAPCVRKLCRFMSIGSFASLLGADALACRQQGLLPRDSTDQLHPRLPICPLRRRRRGAGLCALRPHLRATHRLCDALDRLPARARP